MDSTHYWPSPLPSAAASPSSSRTNSPVLAEQEILAVVHSKVNERVVEYLVERVTDTVAYGLGRASSSKLLTPEGQDSFPLFVQKVLRRAEVTMSVVIGALTYIERARSHLRIAVEEWALHRVFLGSLILAAKYLNDSSLKNAHWALCTRLFGKRDIARVEREFLDVLNWELAVKEKDVAECASRLVAAGVVDLGMGKSRQLESSHDLVVVAKERRGRSEERYSSSRSAIQHRVQAPLPASRTSSRTLSSSNSAPALLMPVHAALPHVPSPLSLSVLRSSSRSQPYDEEDSDDIDSPTSSISSSSSGSSSSSMDSASGDHDSPYTPEHVEPCAYPLPKLMLPGPMPSAHNKYRHPLAQHKRSHAHARIAPYSLPSTRTSSPAAAASAYAFAVPAPPMSSTASSGPGPMLSKLVLPPPQPLPGTHGLYPSCIVIGPYAS